jgi:DNA-binding SARP family transcriptional activator
MAESPPSTITELPVGDEAEPTVEPEAGDHDLIVKVLGATEVWVRGRPIEKWASLRGLALFRYLVLHHPTPVHRERLMDLLWPHSSPRAARNNLNVAMHGLRRSLESGGPGPYIIFRDGCYQLAPDLDLWLDVEELTATRDAGHRHLRIGEAEAARISFEQVVDLYRGELFADEAHGDWFLPTRRLLADHFAEALEIVAGHAHGQGDVVACVDTCHHLLAVDPCRESAHRLLMTAYVAQGQYHLAARQYAICVNSLQEELDVAPHPETTELFLSLLGSNT